MSAFILDASALLALLRDEPGADKVANALDTAQISAVNHAEVVSYYAKAGASRDQIDALLGPLPVAIVPADAALAAQAGLLRAATAKAGLSLGDRFCLALAQREALPAWTADKEWTTIADDVGVTVVTIR